MKKILSAVCSAFIMNSFFYLNNISNIFAEDFIQQAENCELIGCSVENYGLGYEGNGYVKFTNSIGDGINYSINGEEKYSDITIRYSQGSEADQTLSLFVNSKFVQKVNFPSTDEWDTSWSSVKVPVYLSEGNNNIELKYTEGDGIVDIDYIQHEERTNSIKMVIIPHEDDEIFSFCGSIQNMLENGDDVKVVLLTNGDYYSTQIGKDRLMESVEALKCLDFPKEKIIALGYGDSIISDLYDASPDTIIPVSNGYHSNDKTYGNYENNIYDYHKVQTGSEASYTRYNLVSDLENVISVNMPSEIYTTSFYDGHADHSATYKFVEEAIDNIRETQKYTPLLHESIVHGDDSENPWPEQYSSYDPAPEAIPFTNPFPNNDRPLYWENVTKINLTPNMLENKYTAISKYVSQMSWPDFNYSFYKSDEFYWTRNYANIAPYATIEVSSDTPDTGQVKEKVADRIVAGYDMNISEYYEWAANDETVGAWIKLEFDESHAVNKIVLNDRVTTVDNIVSARLDFSDGSSIIVSDIPANGTDCIVDFDTKNITWVKLTVLEATGYNVGLTEFQIIEAQE